MDRLTLLTLTSTPCLATDHPFWVPMAHPLLVDHRTGPRKLVASGQCFAVISNLRSPRNNVKEGTDPIKQIQGLSLTCLSCLPQPSLKGSGGSRGENCSCWAQVAFTNTMLYSPSPGLDPTTDCSGVLLSTESVVHLLFLRILKPIVTLNPIAEKPTKKKFTVLLLVFVHGIIFEG